MFGPGGLVNNTINSLIINKLPIKMTGGKDAPIIHMYIQMGITSSVDWIHVKSAVEATQYKLSYNGEGVYISGYGCGTCRGINHPGGLCPTVDIPNDIPLAENAVPQFAKNKKGKPPFRKKWNSPNKGPAPRTPKVKDKQGPSSSR